MPAENGMPENEDVKKKALLRLAVAGIVTSAALAGLWWLDQSGGEPKKPAVTAPPSPIIAAPQPDVPVPQTETPATPAPADTASPPEKTSAAPVKQILEPPPPPKVSNNPIAPTRPTPPSQTVKAAQPPAQNVTAPPPKLAAEPAPQAQTAAGKGYVVQLGVFSNPENARELVEKLKKQGVRAHLEARVQMGPFLNRQEAEKAQAEMRKLGYNALVTLPYSAVPATK